MPVSKDDKIVQSCTIKVIAILREEMKDICEQELVAYKNKHEEVIAALRAEIIELKLSQEFVCAKYDEIVEINQKQKDEINNLKQSHDSLSSEYVNLKALNDLQTNKLKTLQSNSADLEKKSNSEAIKLDAIDQYSRRQNLEIHGVPIIENEDVIDIVCKISKLVGVKVEKKDISTAHRMPPKRRAKVVDPPAIIARFINRNLRNEIYNRRVVAKHVTDNDFPVQGMKKLFINENLTQARKWLLWRTKQTAKARDFTFIWTMNGKIYVRKDDESVSIIIQCENDLDKLV